MSEATKQQAAQSDHKKAREAVANASNEFGFELFHVFIKRHEREYKNLCFSPFVIFIALNMLLTGARKGTETQLAKVLRLQNYKRDDKERLAAIFFLIDKLLKGNHENLYYAVYLYIDKEYAISPEVKGILRDYFEVKARKISFHNAIESAHIINEDAAIATEGIIDGVITAGELQQEKVQFLLSNAFFYRGFWASRFTKVYPGTFTTYKGSEKVETAVQLMNLVGIIRYLEDSDLKAEIVSLAYETSDLRLMVILPKDKKSDAKYIISQMSRKKFFAIIDAMSNKKTIDVTLPRFALDAQKVSIQRTLIQMGATDLFDKKANLSGFNSQSQLHLTKLVHKSFIIVDERGSLSSKSSVTLKRQRSLGQMEAAKTKVFRADHPFVFMIFHLTTRVVLFMGSFADPSEILEVVTISDKDTELASIIEKIKEEDLDAQNQAP